MSLMTAVFGSKQACPPPPGDRIGGMLLQTVQGHARPLRGMLYRRKPRYTYENRAYAQGHRARLFANRFVRRGVPTK